MTYEVEVYEHIHGHKKKLIFNYTDMPTFCTTTFFGTPLRFRIISPIKINAQPTILFLPTFLPIYMSMTFVITMTDGWIIGMKSLGFSFLHNNIKTTEERNVPKTLIKNHRLKVG